MFDCKFIGLELLGKSLADRERKLKEREKLNAQAVTVIDGWIQRNFQEEGGLVQSGGWKPLEASTIRLREHGGDRILQDIGDLRSKWKHLYTPKKAAIMSGVDYGEQHDKGIGVPQRKILPREEHIMPKLMKIYKTFVRGILK